MKEIERCAFLVKTVIGLERTHIFHYENNAYQNAPSRACVTFEVHGKARRIVKLKVEFSSGFEHEETE